jgi:CP12 domain
MEAPPFASTSERASLYYHLFHKLKRKTNCNQRTNRNTAVPTTMKLSLSMILIGSAAAFQQPAFVGRRHISRAGLSATAAEDAIAAAQAASDKYGASSPEAAVAWEAVEEIDSADNSAAYEKNTANVMSDAELLKATTEFQANLDIVKRLTHDLKDHQKHMNDVAKEMLALKLAPPENRPAPKSPELDAALSRAKQMSAEFGNTSQEARLAWEEVEEIASSGLENAMGEDMTVECLVEAAEHCLALEELDRFINYEKITEGGLSNF